MDGTRGWDFEIESRGRTFVVQGGSLAIRTEDIGHVSKLCVKTLFISENFDSFLCILHSQDVIVGHFGGKTGVYTPAIVSLFTSQEVDIVH